MEAELEALVLDYLSGKPDALVRFAVYEKGETDLLGTIGFNNILMDDHTAEIAYDVHPDYWGLGIASQVCRAILAWGNEALGLSRVTACVLPTNPASIRVLEKCGFRYEKTLKDHRLVRGERRDFLLYSITLETSLQ